MYLWRTPRQKIIYATCSCVFEYNFLTSIFRSKVFITNSSIKVALSFTSKFNTSILENNLCMIEENWIFKGEPVLGLIDLVHKLLPFNHDRVPPYSRSKIFPASLISSARLTWLVVGDVSFSPSRTILLPRA